MVRRPESASRQARSATSRSGQPELQHPLGKSCARKLVASSPASSIHWRCALAGARSSRRNRGTAARPWLGSSLVDRHLAIVDPLLVRPLRPEPLLAGQRFLLDGRVRCRLVRRSRILGDRGPCETDGEDEDDRCSVWESHGGLAKSRRCDTARMENRAIEHRLDFSFHPKPAFDRRLRQSYPVALCPSEICPRAKWFCPREKYRLSKVLGLRCSVLALFPRPP